MVDLSAVAGAGKHRNDSNVPVDLGFLRHT
jgi:hypothetical protein